MFFQHFHLETCFSPQRRAIFPLHIGTSKHVFGPSVFNMFTYKSASRHRFMQFFDIRTSKKVSAADVFCTFSRTKALLATTSCNFATSELQKMLPERQLKCASRHNLIGFFDIGTAKSGPALSCLAHFHLKTCFSPQQFLISTLST